MTQPFFCTFSFNTYDAFILRPPVTHFTFIWWRITFPVDIRYLLTIEVVHTYLFIETHSPPRIWNNLRSFLKTGIKFGWKHRKKWAITTTFYYFASAYWVIFLQIIFSPKITVLSNETSKIYVSLTLNCFNFWYGRAF